MLLLTEKREKMNELRERVVWVIVVLCVLFFMLFAVKKIYPAELHGQVEMGKTLENDWAVMNVQLELHHSIWIFDNVYFGGWETWVIRNGIFNSPFKDIYNTGYRIGYKNFYVEIEHYCNHPVYSSYNAEWWNVNRRSGNSLSTVSIGVKW